MPSSFKMTARRSPYVLLVFTFVCASIAFDDHHYHYQDVGQVSVSDVDEVYSASLLKTDKIAELTNALRHSFDVLPKNAFGVLSHEAARRALYKYFMRRHRWSVVGTEPFAVDEDVARPETLSPASTHWVVSYLISKVEADSAKAGLDIRDLATVGVAMYGVIGKEADKRLREVCRNRGIATSGIIKEDVAYSMLLSAMVVFAYFAKLDIRDSAGWESMLHDPSERHRWEDLNSWIHSVARRHGLDGDVHFDELPGIIVSIEEEYSEQYTQQDCREIKTELLRLAARSPKLGRVRLPDFYNASLEDRTFDFIEGQDYLRDLGALDDHDFEHAAVIVPNYVLSPTSCDMGSRLFAVCCHDECEDLLVHVERDSVKSAPTPTRIATVVAGLSSETVAAPRTLSPLLLRRLDQLAENNNGKVDIHSRLFAQWMHHAFPFECAYPSTVPQKPLSYDEWHLQNGKAAHAPVEERRRHVEEDSCPANLPAGTTCGDGADDVERELPWSDIDATLQVLDFGVPPGDSHWSWWVAAVALLPLGVAGYHKAKDNERCTQGDQGALKLVLISLLCTGSYLAGLVDPAFVLFVTVGGIVSIPLMNSVKDLRYAPHAKKVDDDIDVCV